MYMFIKDISLFYNETEAAISYKWQGLDFGQSFMTTYECFIIVYDSLISSDCADFCLIMTTAFQLMNALKQAYDSLISSDCWLLSHCRIRYIHFATSKINLYF